MPMTQLPNPSLYPFRSRWFESGQGRMHYIDEGAGAPIVFVHGMPTWSFLWRNLVRQLRTSHRAVAVDHLGFGLSDKPSDADFHPRAHSERLSALLDSLGLEDVTLVVHDFGGPIGLGHALQRPSTIRRLVLLNTWMWSLSTDERALGVDRIVRGATGHALYRWFNGSTRWLVPKVLGPNHRLSEEVHRHYVDVTTRSSERVAQLAMARSLVGASDWYGSLWDQRHRLAEIPASFVWGMKDPAFGEADLDRWLELFPDAEVLRLEDVGHFPQEESPGRLLEAFRALPATKVPRRGLGRSEVRT